MSTVLVTGGSGMLGSYVVRQLESENWVSSVIAPRSSEYDLRQQNAVQQLFSDHKPDVVIHTAGRVGGIGDCRTHPGGFYYDNLTMGVHTFHEAYRSGVKKFVGIGSVCSYPKHASVPFKEDTLWDGYPEETNAPYGIAKRATLVMGQAYYEEYDFNAVHLLLVNLYGPGDKFDLEKSHVIAAFIRKFSDARDNGVKTVTLWGDGSPTREFIFVEDAACAVVRAAEKYNDPAPVNIGSGQEISIRDLAEKIRVLVGYEGDIVWDTSMPNGQPRRMLDVSRAKAGFGFEAQTSLDDGLRKTVDWFNEHRDTTV